MKSRSRRTSTSREELGAITREYHHLLEEHRRAGTEGRVRRHMESRLHELELRFERLLDEWAPEGELQGAWRAHLHGDAPEPSQPAAEMPLVFQGRAKTSSIVEIRRRADRGCDVELDGHVVERLEDVADFPGAKARGAYTLNGLVFQEVFFVSNPALEALSEFVSEREPHPPWQYAAELTADGLIDRHFGLTSRGHRALARERRT